MKKIILILFTLIFTVIVGVRVTEATGTLIPLWNEGDDTQYSLNDIYKKLTTGESSTIGSGTMVVPEVVVASFNTLIEIYEAIPETLFLSSSTVNVPVGINRSTTTLDVIDTDLVASNIKSGINIFGIDGTYAASSGGSGEVSSVTWQANDPDIQLCWDANQGCSAPNILDPVGDGSLLLGGVEYCKYLDADGVTVQTTLQDIWRLPTLAEYIAVDAGQLSTFLPGHYYWSSTDHVITPNFAWYWASDTTALQNSGKNNLGSIRCVK